MRQMEIQVRRSVRHQTVSQRPPSRRRGRCAPILAILAGALAWAVIVLCGVIVGAWLA